MRVAKIARWRGRMTPADEHHVVDMTYIPRKMRKKKLQDEDGKGDELLARQTSATVSKTLHVQNI